MRPSRGRTPQALVLVFALLLLAGCGGHPGGSGDGGTDGGTAGGRTDAGSPDGGAQDGGAPPVPVPSGTIAKADADATATPYLAGNTVQHYCNCLAGATAGCVAGDDAGGDGTAAHPYRTLQAAMKWVNAATGRTAALCRGGSFAGTTASHFGYTFGTAGCPAGTICNEVREYPIGGAGPKPLVTNALGAQTLFSSNQGATTGGFRFLNLSLKGTPDTAKHSNLGFFLYTWRPGTHVHDVTLENVDLEGFDVGIQDAQNANQGITVTGCHFTHSTQWAFLGGSSDLTISYDAFVDNGSDTTFDHSIYVGSHAPIEHVEVVGNYVSGFNPTTGATRCIGEPIVGHAAITGLTVADNLVVEATTADPQCYGINFTDGGSPGPSYYRQAVFSGNIVVNGGLNGIRVDHAPGAVIANNLVIHDGPNGGYGIVAAGTVARTSPGDDVETAVTLVNNTVYFTAHSDNGIQGGIFVGKEGTGYVVADNTVSYRAASHGKQQVACYRYPLPASAYVEIDHNACDSADPAFVWEAGTRDGLAAWQAKGFDQASLVGDPKLSGPYPGLPSWADTDVAAALFEALAPGPGSPLVGAGDPARAPRTDITGATRPAAPSIGAYE